MLHTQIRPARFRPILTFSLIAILLVLLWVGLEVYFALTAKADPTVDYGAKLMEHAAAWQGGDESDDVWSVLTEAVELHQRLIDGLVDEDTDTAYLDLAWVYEAISGYDKLLEDEISDEKWIGNGYDSEAHGREQLDMSRDLSLKAIVEWEGSGILARLDVVAEGTRAIRPMPDTTTTLMLSMLLPEPGEMRKMARGLRAQMILSRDAEDWQAYARAFEHAMAIGRIECYQQILIERLVGIAIRALAVGQVHEDVMAGRLPSEALAMVDAAMERQSGIPPMSYAFEGERAMGLDMVQWLHDSRGRLILSGVSGFGGMPGGLRHPIVNVASIAYPRKAATEQWFNTFYDEAGAWYDLPFHERRSGVNPLDAMEDKIATSWRTPIQAIMLPALGKVSAADYHLHLNELGLRTLVAIERFRLDTGALPALLVDLVPGYLQELPVDPYADGVALLRYRVLESEDAEGRSYLLYSVGYDGTDDDATPNEFYRDALRYIGRDTDYIINHTESAN